jgi:hypothetical protein
MTKRGALLWSTPLRFPPQKDEETGRAMRPIDDVERARVAPHEITAIPAKVEKPAPFVALTMKAWLPQGPTPGSGAR